MNKLIPYALSFASFLFSSLDKTEQENIKEVVLYGSASRGDYRKDSDVDIFINVYNSNSISKRVEKIVEDFYQTEIFKRWRLIGIENTISCITDNLEKWGDLKTSIVSNGLSLFSKYASKSKGELFVVFYWDKIGFESKRVLISKKLYGYRTKKSVYKGLLELTNSTKLGSNCILTPLESAKKIDSVFKENKITLKRIHVSKL